MSSEVFFSDRRRLFSIAYRMLGSASDAEDVLQDAWLRYESAGQAAVRSPQAFATTIVTRLCLDRLKSARIAREAYIGPWLPEPVLTSDAAGPDVAAQRAESVTLAFLVLLETLSPEERAVFLLKDIFEYDHAEVAEMLGTTPENSRQLLHRAKARLTSGRPTLTGSAASRRKVAERFTHAFTSGDGSTLADLLAADVGLWSDGGGKVSAARRPLHGRPEVLNFLLGLYRTAQRAAASDRRSVQIDEVNAEPALILRRADRIDAIFVLSVDDGTIAAVRVIRNPDKLTAIERQLRSATH